MWPVRTTRFLQFGAMMLCLLGVWCFALPIYPAFAGRHCGAKGDWRSSLIPDEWPPQQTKKRFQSIYGRIKTVPVYKACMNHDNCYGSPGAWREACDRQFYDDMCAECGRIYSGLADLPLRQACRMAAKGYFKAVVKYGESAFRAAQGDRNNSIRQIQSTAQTGQQTLADDGAFTEMRSDVAGMQDTAADAGNCRDEKMFRAAPVSDTLYNGIVSDFRVYLTFEGSDPAFLICIPGMGSGVVSLKEMNLYHADSERKIDGEDSYGLNVNGLQRIPDSGVEILKGDRRMRIEVWWENHCLGFTIFYDDITAP